MGRKLDAHNAYLADWHAKHPNIVQPAIYRSEPVALAALRHEATSEALHYGSRKVWTDAHTATLYTLSNGQVVEAGTHDNQSAPLLASFPTRDDWARYARPMSFNEFWG